jgi:cell division septal protein FtsQ
MKEIASSAQRAEKVRRRRLQNSHAASSATVKRKHKLETPPPPPVMARSVKPSPGISRNRKSSSGRRLYRLNLNAAQGVEMSLPSLPRIPVGWRAISFVLAALLSFALYHFYNSPTYRIDAANISGLKFVTQTDVNVALGITGKPIYSLDATKIQSDLLEAFPEFSSSAVQIELPNTVVITVTERVPVMVWLQDGKSNLVDIEGMNFPLRHEITGGAYPVVEASGDPPRVAVVETPEITSQLMTISKITGTALPGNPVVSKATQLLSPEMVQAVLGISEKAPAGAKLIYDPLHGLGWIDRRGWKVFLGDAQDVDVKVSIYRAIFEQLKDSESRPTMISVEYIHAPYYRLEE